MHDYECFIELSRILDSPQDYSSEFCAKFLEESVFSNDLGFISRNILFSLRANSRYISHYVNLASFLIKINPDFVYYIVRDAFSPVYPDDLCLNKISDLIFLRHLIKDNIISCEIVIEELKKLMKSKFMLFQRVVQIIFTDIIIQHNESWFNELYFDFLSTEMAEDRFLESYVSENSPKPLIIKWFSQINHYQMNQWENHKKSIDNCCDFQSFIYYIKNDDDEYLKNELLNPLFSIYDPVCVSIYEPEIILKNYPSQLMVAAFYGSLKCFKLLILNKANIIDADMIENTLPHYAVAGGNIEIIRILLSQQLDFAITLPCAVQWRRDLVFKWILDSFPLDLDNNDLIEKIELKATESNNIAALEFLKRKKQLVKNCINPFSLHSAIRYNSVDVVGFLLGYEELDVNFLEEQSMHTPLWEAVYLGNEAIIEQLLCRKDININIKDNKFNLVFIINHH